MGLTARKGKRTAAQEVKQLAGALAQGKEGLEECPVGWDKLRGFTQKTWKLYLEPGQSREISHKAHISPWAILSLIHSPWTINL